MSDYKIIAELNNFVVLDKSEHDVECEFICSRLNVVCSTYINGEKRHKRCIITSSFMKGMD